MADHGFNTVAAVRRHYERLWLRYALRLAGGLVLLVVSPLVLGGWLGNWLDVRLSSGPLWLIVCLLMAAGIAAFLAYRRTRDYVNRYQQLVSEEKAAFAELEGH